MKRCLIYINDNIIRLRQAVISRNSQTILKEGEINISSLKKETIAVHIAAFLKENKITPENPVLCLPRSQISIKYLSLPASDDAEIKKMLEYELNNLFPLKPEELIVDYQITQKEPKGYSDLILFAAPKEAVLNQILTLKRAGIVLDAINISTVSLFNQFCLKNKPPANYLIVYFEHALMEIIFISKNKLLFSREISAKQNTGKTDLIKAVRLAADILKDKGHLIDKISVGGSSWDLEDFAKELENTLGSKATVDNTLRILDGLTISDNENALRVNLLPQEIKLNKEKNRKKRLALYLCALLLLNLSLAANIAYLNLKAKQEYLYQLKSEIRKIEAPASELKKKKLSVVMLKNYLNSNRLALKLMSELYRVAPEKINLSVLDIVIRNASAVMTVSGQAKDSGTALKFSNAIKNSGAFKNADVKYIKKISASSQEQTVDFEINCGF